MGHIHAQKLVIGFLTRVIKDKHIRTLYNLFSTHFRIPIYRGSKKLINVSEKIHFEKEKKTKKKHVYRSVVIISTVLEIFHAIKYQVSIRIKFWSKLSHDESKRIYIEPILNIFFSLLR